MIRFVSDSLYVTREARDTYSVDSRNVLFMFTVYRCVYHMMVIYSDINYTYFDKKACALIQFTYSLPFQSLKIFTKLPNCSIEYHPRKAE